MKKRYLQLSMVSMILVSGVLLSGCSNSAAPMTKTEQQDFKGGPMPESAKKAIAEQMRKAAEKGGNVPGPGGVPGAPAAPAPGKTTP
jgi:hypothetical protein